MYGYLPPSSHLVVTPPRRTRGFMDGSAHRMALPSTYQRYTLTGADPFYREDTEEIQMLLRPLFFTSFLIDDQLADEGLDRAGADHDRQRVEQDGDRRGLPAGAARGRGAGGPHLAAQRRVREGLGIYDRTVTYDSIGSFERGSRHVRGHRRRRRRAGGVHTHFGDDLAYSMTVGVTHWEEMGAGPMPGPQPTFFFAPTGSTSARRTGAPAR